MKLPPPGLSLITLRRLVTVEIVFQMADVEALQRESNQVLVNHIVLFEEVKHAVRISILLPPVEYMSRK